MARFEITGRKAAPGVCSILQEDEDAGGKRKVTPHLLRVDAQSLDALTIVQFCASHGISRTTYYNLKKLGLQPDELQVFDRIIITRESAAAWRRKRTAATKRARAAG